jgi:hypothetical protein
MRLPGLTRFRAHHLQFQVAMRLRTPFARKPTEELKVPAPKFVGEQDGVPERLFKGELSEVLQGRKNLLKAYLAQVRYGDSKEILVCLCLAGTNGEDRSLVEAIHSLFAQHFNPAAHLDILFLKPKQEKQLSAVCNPFYKRN